MTISPTDVVQAILDDPTNSDVVGRYVDADATYVSLNYENSDLKKILPWAGTSKGPQAVVDTFLGVGAYWTKEDFQVQSMFGAGENVAVFGSFTYRSNTLGKSITSPFSIFAKVNDGKVSYMQFMEDTFGTTSTFRNGGVSTFRSNPDGSEVEIGAGT